MESKPVIVTDWCIQNGVRRDSDKCPIALAFKNMGYDDVLVDYGYVDFGMEEYALPVIADRFIEDFDSGKVVHPIEFNTSQLRLYNDEEYFNEL